MLSIEKKRYDFIFSMGEACSCSSTLRHMGLQFASYPFDWIAGLTFAERAEIVHSHFDSFFIMEDFEDTGKNNGDPENPCQIYYNRRTHLMHNHDFLVGVPLKSSFPKVAAKYKKRSDRLYQKIEEAETVLAVYIETPIQNHATITDDEIQRGYQRLAQTFPNKKVDLLYLTNRVGKTEVIQLSQNITRIYLNYKRKKMGGQDYAVETPVLQKVFRHYRLNRSTLQRAQRLFWRFLSSFIFNKVKRRRFRKRHHV